MANSFLGGDAQNIASGWPGPPQLQAPNIGELVKSILGNRLARDKMTQESVADTIKQLQTQRSDSAYIQAAQNAGVLPQGDYSGMSAKEASDLAQRIQDMTPDTDMDALHQAQTRALDRAGGEPRTWTDQFGNVHVLGPRGGVSAPLKPPQPQDTAAKLAQDVKAITGGYSLSDIQGGLTPTYDPDTGALTTSIPQMVKNKAGQFEKAVTLPDGTSAALSDVVAQQKEEYKNLPTATKPVTLPPDLSKRYRKLTDPNYAPPADAAATSSDAGGGSADGQYPVGTRARRGNTWFTKQADGSWQPDAPNG